MDHYEHIVGLPAHGHWAKILSGKLSLPGKEILSAFLASVELRAFAPIHGLAIWLVVPMIGLAI